MRKRRELIEGAIYHVTSRTNDKIKVFDKRMGRKIILEILYKSKTKYNFQLLNFCIMPTHIHLLLKPAEKTSLDKIMQWIKTNSAKWWNRINGSTDHLWGERYFSKIIKTQNEYEIVMNYIDNNPVKAGLVTAPEDWVASGAFFRKHGVSHLHQI